MKTREIIKTAALAALATATGAGVAAAQSAPPPPPPSVTTAWNGAPETREEDRRFHVSGRFMYDIASTDADWAGPTGGAYESGIRSYARRAFIGVDGRLTTHWRYNVKFDVTFGSAQDGAASSANNRITLKADDLYLEYAGDWGSVFVGNGNWVSPMEDRDSSLNIPFNERSFLITAAGFGKKPGVGFLTNGGNWSLGAAVQSSDGLDISDNAANGGEPYFLIARGTWAPIYQQTPDGVTVVGFGLSARHRDRSSHLNSAFSYSPGALSNKASNNAGVGAGESDNWIGAEFVAQYNAFAMDAEYGRLSTTRVPGSAVQAADADATGYYVDFFYALTGESRRYSAADGSHGAWAPRRTLGSDGGIGALILSARYEDLDLTDAGFANASATADRRNDTSAWTAGATWVPIGHVKFQLNYSSTDINYVINDTGHRDNTINAITLRSQFDW
ncbi:MAG: porin [Pseudomonadota bacterium]